MPLWTIYHPSTVFQSDETKETLSKAITAIYTAVPLPAFYVNVIFIPVQDIWIGGVKRPSPHSAKNGPGQDSSRPWVRITISNIARKLPNAEVRDRFLGRVDAALKPFIEDQGYDWEYHVEETNRDLWKVQGLVPPMPGSEAELEWDEKNQPVPYEKSKGGLL